MKVLYLATSFPEPDKGATIYTDLAEALHEQGHQITVAVSEQVRNLSKTQMKQERGCNVLRIVTGNYYDVGFLEKGITSLKIPVVMRRAISKYLDNHTFDFILFESPPVTNASLVKWAKKKFNCPAYLMLKDIFPQNAVDIGIIKRNGIIYKYFKKKEKKLYEIADWIGCMSSGNRDYIIKQNSWLNKDKVEIFPNTKKITNNYLLDNKAVRENYGIPINACVFLFGGNMGRPQYIELLCEAASCLKDHQEIFFMFVGRGTERKKLENTIKDNKIKNALLLENMPRGEYDDIIKACDVGIIVLDPRFTIPNYPSRILSYLEYAKPVLAATDKVTDLRAFIEETNCGYWVWSGDTDAFISKILEMTKSSNLNKLGFNGRKHLEKKLNVSGSVKILSNHFDRNER